MKKIFFLLFVSHFLYAQKAYRASNSRSWDLLHTKLYVKTDYAKQYLYGTATLTLKPYFYTQDSLVLDAKGFEIQGITNAQKGYYLYQYDRKKLIIRLEKSFTRKDTLQLTIQYIAKTNELPEGGSAAISSDKGLYFINPTGTEGDKPRQIWTQGETEASSCWFPTIDSPNEKHTQEIAIVAEKKFKTLSNGRLISSTEHTDNTRTDVWKQDLPHAPYLTMMAIGDFAVVKEKAKNGVELSYYVEPSYEKQAKSIFGRTDKMMQFFEEFTGVPYAWDKYAQIVVRDYVSGAMENTTATIHGESVQKTEAQLLDENDDKTIAHELFHHWFGNLVTCESWSNLPLNESFANYSEYLWTEHHLGKQEADLIDAEETMNFLYGMKSRPAIEYHYKDKEDMFDEISYQKGGRILHRLRKIVGDEAFKKALNIYLTRHQFGTAELDDLRQAFEESTGEDLNWFFDQWFLKGGVPSVEASKSYQNGMLTFTLTQSAKNPYRLPISIAIVDTNGQLDTKTIWLEASDSLKTVSFAYQKAPLASFVDADFATITGVRQNISSQETMTLFKKTDSYRMKEMLLYFAKESPTFEKEWTPILLNDSFWKIREKGIEQVSSTKKPKQYADLMRSFISKESNNQLKALALGFLSNLGDKNDVSLFKNLLTNPSPAVSNAALQAYLASNPSDLEQTMQQFASKTDYVQAFANYYAKQTGSQSYEWFRKTLQGISNDKMHEILQPFGENLIIQNADIQKRSLDYLENIALKNTNVNNRFRAYEALNLLSNYEGVDEKLANIRANEKNTQLLSIYQMYGQMNQQK